MQFAGKIARCLLHINADTDNDMMHPVKLGLQLGQYAGHFFATKEQVIGPLDPHLEWKGD